jgi:hypothetical protein
LRQVELDWVRFNFYWCRRSCARLLVLVRVGGHLHFTLCL